LINVFKLLYVSVLFLGSALISDVKYDFYKEVTQTLNVSGTIWGILSKIYKQFRYHKEHDKLYIFQYIN
jgi:hypothetical protein